jgi:hypothetical protein
MDGFKVCWSLLAVVVHNVDFQIRQKSIESDSKRKEILEIGYIELIINKMIEILYTLFSHFSKAIFAKIKISLVNFII